jgi:hypothetical protein
MIHNLAHSILHGLGGIQQYGLVSMCLFCLVFAGVLVSVFLLKKGHLDYMSRVALDDQTTAEKPVDKTPNTR